MDQILQFYNFFSRKKKIKKKSFFFYILLANFEVICKYGEQSLTIFLIKEVLTLKPWKNHFSPLPPPTPGRLQTFRYWIFSSGLLITVSTLSSSNHPVSNFVVAKCNFANWRKIEIHEDVLMSLMSCSRQEKKLDDNNDRWIDIL